MSNQQQCRGIILRTETSAPAGTYWASFRLLNLGNANESSFRDSGTFNVDFTPVPEPSAFLGIGAFALLAFLRKNRLKRAVKF